MALKFDMNSLVSGINELNQKAYIAIKMYGNTAAKKLEGDAKTSARWVDRTGAARNRLTGYTEDIDVFTHKNVRIILAHGVDYGIWLELANEKRYAIIQPTIDLKSAEIFRGLDGLFNRMGR